MATKKPSRRVPTRTEPAETMMGNQDTVNKGDSTARSKVLVTFWTTPERRAAMKEFAAEHEMSMTRLIIEGIEMRMKKG